MPLDLEKKRERDRLYRLRKKEKEGEQFLIKRREIMNKSYKKRSVEMSDRTRRSTNKKRREAYKIKKTNEQQIVQKDIAKIATSKEDNRSDTNLKSTAAKKRENKKRLKFIQNLKSKYDRLKTIHTISMKEKKKTNVIQNHASIVPSPIKFVNQMKDNPSKAEKTLLLHYELMKTMKTKKRKCITIIHDVSKSVRGSKKHFNKTMNIDARTINQKKETIIRQTKINANKVEQFLCRDDNSRMTAGKKEVLKKTEIQCKNDT